MRREVLKNIIREVDKKVVNGEVQYIATSNGMFGNPKKLKLGDVYKFFDYSPIIDGDVDIRIGKNLLININE